MDDAILDMVAVDGMPFSICSMVGFNSAMKTLVPGAEVMSRWNVSRVLKRRIVTKVKPYFEGVLEKLPPKSISFILDFWTSRMQQSVIGVKIQYISSTWVLENAVLAFKHCEGSLTGENIETIVSGILKESNVTRSQVNCIMADNAANIDKAFRDKVTTCLLLAPSNDHNSLMVEEIEPRVQVDENEDGECDGENLGFGLTDSVAANLEDFLDPIDESWNRKRCLCHILNLVVKGAIRKSASAQLALDKVKAATNFFRKSNLHHEELKKKTNNIGLRAPVDTRWNSWLLCIERILEVNANCEVCIHICNRVVYGIYYKKLMVRFCRGMSLQALSPFLWITIIPYVEEESRLNSFKKSPPLRI
jgi:hypothetical protein